MKQYKARDKITQKMSRDGAIEVNAATGKQKRISKRAREAALLKTPEQQAAQDAQAAQPIPGNPAPDISPNAPPLPHAPGTEAAQDTGTAERVLEHIDGAHTRRASSLSLKYLCKYYHMYLSSGSMSASAISSAVISSVLYVQ